MRGNPLVGNLVPLDLEIKATCRRNNAERRRKKILERTAQPSLEETQSSKSSSTFPDFRESKVGASEAHIDVSSIGACRPRIFFINGFLYFLEDEWQRNGEGRERGDATSRRR